MPFSSFRFSGIYSCLCRKNNPEADPLKKEVCIQFANIRILFLVIV